MSISPWGRFVAPLLAAGVAFVAVAGPAVGAPADGPGRNPDRGRVDDVVIVRFERGASAARRARVAAAVDAPKMRRVSPLTPDTVVMKLPAGESVEAALETLAEQPGVRSVEPDYYVRAAETSDDPRYLSGELWGMLGDATSPSNPFGTGAGEAWVAGAVGDAGVHVAVIDGGVDIAHPDLAANIWTNPSDPPDGVDNDGNGYVDDVHGWDFYWDDASFIHGDGAESHATHVAGSIGAQGGNGIGVAGVGWRTTIIPVKFLGGPSGQGTMSDAAAALDYVTALRLRGVNVVAANASWGCLSTSPGCGLSTVLQGAIERAGAAGVLVVAAAGNGGADIDATPFYPASQTCPQGGWDCIISVANIGSTGARSGNFGASSVDLGAPGGGILSTTPSASYGTMSGTSMAAAYVSGAIALCASLDPGVGPATLRSRVLESGTTTGSLDGSTVTGKRLDVGALAQQCGATVPDVVGLMAGAAHDAIEAADLDPVRDPDAFHASVPAGKVISQQPDPGRLRAHGSPVHYVVSKGPAPVPVPNVVNSTPSAADSAISSAGFQSAQGADEHSASVPTGLVARQDPSAGALRVPGSTVTFFVSKGPAPITVPNVVGSTPGAASAAISGTGFSPVQGADEYSASVAAGLVARQDPPAGTSLPPGSTVSYFVSKGRPAVPDVVNKPEAAAIADLAAVTLVPGPRTQAYHASIPAGNALSTNPPPGTLVDPGSAVAYVISLGPIAVPNLVGLSQATAATTLTAAGLSSGAVTQAMDATIPAGNVISQSPVAGTAAGSGDPVSYVVSAGPAPVAVPDVVGQPEATALSGLAAAGLTAGARSEAYDATIAAGSVVGTAPTAGTLVARGTAIAYVISVGAPPPPAAAPAPDPGAAAPPPAQPAPGVVLATVVVDDLSPQFRRRADGWQQASTGYRRHHYWVPARAAAARRVATWRADLAGPGTYRVVASIPSRNATTRRAVYKIQTADGWARRVLDQDTHRGEWVSLGDYRLDATPMVKLSDRTGERAALGRLVGFDAIRFVPLDGLAVAATQAPELIAEPATPLAEAGTAEAPAAPVGPQAEGGTSVESDPSAEPTTEDGPETKLGATAEPRADPDPSAGPRSGPEAETEPTADPNAKPGTEEKSGQQSEPKSEPTAEPKTEDAPEEKSEPRPEPKPEPTAEPKTEDAPEEKSEPRPEAKPEPTAEPKTEDAPEEKSEPRPEPQPEPQSGAEATPEPAPDPTPAATPEPTPEPPPALAPGPAESPPPGSADPAA